MGKKNRIFDNKRLAAIRLTHMRCYQWQFNGSNISGATNAFLTLTNISFAAAGEYRCLVSNVLGSTTSAAATLTVAHPPLLFSTLPTELNWSNGVFRARLSGLIGTGPVIIYRSTNLVNWDGIFTNPPVIGTLDYVDPAASNHTAHFYRAAEGQ